MHPTQVTLIKEILMLIRFVFKMILMITCTIEAGSGIHLVRIIAEKKGEAATILAKLEKKVDYPITVANLPRYTGMTSAIDMGCIDTTKLAMAFRKPAAGLGPDSYSGILMHERKFIILVRIGSECTSDTTPSESSPDTDTARSVESAVTIDTIEKLIPNIDSTGTSIQKASFRKKSWIFGLSFQGTFIDELSITGVTSRTALRYLSLYTAFKKRNLCIGIRDLTFLNSKGLYLSIDNDAASLMAISASPLLSLRFPLSTSVPSKLYISFETGNSFQFKFSRIGTRPARTMYWSGITSIPYLLVAIQIFSNLKPFFYEPFLRCNYAWQGIALQDNVFGPPLPEKAVWFSGGCIFGLGLTRE